MLVVFVFAHSQATENDADSAFRRGERRLKADLVISSCVMVSLGECVGVADVRAVLRGLQLCTSNIRNNGR